MSVKLIYSQRYQSKLIAAGRCRYHPENPRVKDKTMCQWCLDKMKARDAETRRIVMEHYGAKCSCSKCNETTSQFLTIDHVNDDGYDHRRRVGSGTLLYRWLIRNNFPDGFRILCFNCNSGRALNNGICPHMSAA